MDQLQPVGPADIAELYAHPENWVRANMVATVDGDTVIEGRVGGITGDEDQELLNSLRHLADVVLVGAGTIRAEQYGPLSVHADVAHQRAHRGQTPEPGLAIMSRRLRLDPAAELFQKAQTRPIVITQRQDDPDWSVRRHRLEEVADVVVIESTADAIPALHERGLTRVLTEGGPGLLADLLSYDQVDELCLTISPLIAGHQDHRLLGDDTPVIRLKLASVAQGTDGSLFLRYQRGEG